MAFVLDSFIAAVAVSGGQVVRISGNDAASLAQADAAVRITGTVGVAAVSGTIAAGGRFNAALSGGPVAVLLETGLTPVAGQTLYVSAAVAGRATTVNPGAFAQVIGTVQSAARYGTDSTVTAAIVPSGAFGALLGDFVANWALSLARYFLVDNDAGLDTNLGYVDATPGATIVPTDLAIKTVDRLYQILPRVGAGRTCVVLLKSKAAGTYLDVNGVAASLLLRGFVGYNRLVVRGSTDLTNSAADRLTCGGRTAAGFNISGYNITVETRTINAVTNATPVAVTTTASHGLTTGDQAVLSAIGGQPSANGEYQVTVTGAATFTLNNTRVIPTEAYTSGGTLTYYKFTLNGGGAPVFPAMSASLGYRIRFDANTTTVALRNTCYEVFALGNDTVVPGRAFAAAPAASDVCYIEEAGASFSAVEYQGEEAISLSGLQSTSHIIVQGTDGIPTSTSFSAGGAIASFCQAVTSFVMFGPLAQGFCVNQYFDETNTAVTNGGLRARDYSFRAVRLLSQFRAMAFGTTSPNIYTDCVFSSCHTNFTYRGMDIIRCNTGGASIITGSFTFAGIGKGTTATSKRNRLGGSAHNGSINLVQSSVSLYGNFFDGATSNLIFIVGVNVATAIDDCVGAGTTDVPGINVGDNGRMCDVSIGIGAPCSAGGSAGQEVRAAFTTSVTYATLAAINPVMDGRMNRIQGAARFTSLVIV